jgi:hypothetical protein
MTIRISFRDVCEYIKSDEPKLIETMDSLLGVVLIGSLVFTPAALPALSLLTVKDQLIRIGKDVFHRIVGKNDADFLSRDRRMENAYCLACYIAFFNALDIVLVSALSRTGLTEKDIREEFFPQESKESVVFGGEKLVTCEQDEFGLANAQVTFPHPFVKLDNQKEELEILYKQLTDGFISFVSSSKKWKTVVNLQNQKKILEDLISIPEIALSNHDALCYELSARFQEFFIWLVLRKEHPVKKAFKDLNENTKKIADLVSSSRAIMDLGFLNLEEIILSIPELITQVKVNEVTDDLNRRYKAIIERPIIEDESSPGKHKEGIIFPKISEAFIPQSYKRVYYDSSDVHLEDENTWNKKEKRDDLDVFLLSYLSSPYSYQTPLLVLGHPGCGKSLLSKTVAARFHSRTYTPLYVPLRKVTAGARIQRQIEEGIYSISGREVKWTEFSSFFKTNPPLVILDGYDELIQASGMVFSNYLEEICDFQKREEELGRPVRVIITSRITLISKAQIPIGTTVIKLEEFDDKKIEKWISIWNSTNNSYFRNTTNTRFEFPKSDRILELARQPLLLLMLAIYDSDGNQLKKTEKLDRTVLYNGLIRKFIKREKVKYRHLRDFTNSNEEKEADDDMKKLGVAALGMFCRNSFHITSRQLSEDLELFDAETEHRDSEAKALSKADLLLGSFFFIHKSKARLRGEQPGQYDETMAFEFLHNTFGEFLIADFILNTAIRVTKILKSFQNDELLQAEYHKRLTRPDELDSSWFSSLIYSPLYNKPVVLEMMREWINHLTEKEKYHKSDFLKILDLIIAHHIKGILLEKSIPSIMLSVDTKHIVKTPLVGHISIYTLNLIILRAVIGDDEYVFNEQDIVKDTQKIRPWDRLTYLWLSWFSFDDLRSLTDVFTSRRMNSKIIIIPRRKFNTGKMDSRLKVILNVSNTISNNILSGIVGLIVSQSSSETNLSTIRNQLESENIDLELEFILKILRNDPWASSKALTLKEKPVLLEEAFKLAAREDNYDALDELLNILIRNRYRKAISSSLYKLLLGYLESKVKSTAKKTTFEARGDILSRIFEILVDDCRRPVLIERLLMIFNEGFEQGRNTKGLTESMQFSPLLTLSLLKKTYSLSNEKKKEVFIEVFSNPTGFAVLTKIFENFPEEGIDLLWYAHSNFPPGFSKDFVVSLLRNLEASQQFIGISLANIEVVLELLQFVKAVWGIRTAKEFIKSFNDKLVESLPLAFMQNLPAIIQYQKIANPPFKLKPDIIAIGESKDIRLNDSAFLESRLLQTWKSEHFKASETFESLKYEVRGKHDISSREFILAAEKSVLVFEDDVADILLMCNSLFDSTPLSDFAERTLGRDPVKVFSLFRRMLVLSPGKCVLLALSFIGYLERSKKQKLSKEFITFFFQKAFQTYHYFEMQRKSPEVLNELFIFLWRRRSEEWTGEFFEKIQVCTKYVDGS